VDKNLSCAYPVQKNFCERKKIKIEAGPQNLAIGNVKEPIATTKLVQKCGLVPVSLQESTLIGTNTNCFLTAFFGRFSRSPFIVSLGIRMLQFAKTTCVSGPHNSPATLRIREHTQSAIHLVCIGLGALQEKQLNHLFHVQLLQQIKELMTNIDASKLFSSEVVAARCLFALYWFICIPEQSNNEFQNKLLNLCSQTSKQEWESVDEDVKHLHTFVSFLFLLVHHWDEASKYVLVKVRQSFSSRRWFSLMSSLMQQDLSVHLSEQGISIVDRIFAQSDGFGEAFTFCLSLCWSLLIKKALLHPSIPDGKRAEALGETSELICLFANSICVRQDSIVKFYIHLADLFSALLLQNYSKAQGLLQSLFFSLNDSLMLHSFIVYPKLMHFLHFLCIAFSKLEMYDSFGQLLVMLQAMPHRAGGLNFPACCPLSLHGVCESAECEAVWRLFQMSDIDGTQHLEDSLTDFLVDLCDLV